MALRTFKGLQSCWRNAHFGRGKALLKALVAYGPNIDQARLKLKFLDSTETIPFPKTAREKELMENQETCVGLDGVERDVCEGWAAKIFETCGYRENSVECKEAQQAFKQYQNICVTSARILEIDTDASQAAAHKAFKEQALKWHPDKHTTDKELAAATFTKISQAYEDRKKYC